MLLLRKEVYDGLYGELKVWRDQIDPQTTPDRKGILPFVKGLKFSAQILYIANDLLEGSKLKAVWGHIVNEKDEYNVYSRECDIIIYNSTIPNWKVNNWNGKRQDRIMDFYFIRKSAAVGVISCKSNMDTTDKAYPKLMKKYVDNVWLFAECCGHNREASLRKQAKKYGYKDLWFLYSWEVKKESVPNQKSWERFEDSIKKIAGKHKF